MKQKRKIKIEIFCKKDMEKVVCSSVRSFFLHLAPKKSVTAMPFHVSWRTHYDATKRTQNVRVSCSRDGDEGGLQGLGRGGRGGKNLAGNMTAAVSLSGFFVSKANGNEGKE